MKAVILTTVMTLFSLSLVAQKQDLREMGTQQRNEYLIKLAKEIAHQFGPEWCDKGKLIAQVDDTLAVFKVYGEERPEVKKNEGRLYHRVTLNYDNVTRQKIGWKYAAIVLTWADDGEPFAVVFGNNYGTNFYAISYREWLKTGVRKEDQSKYEEMDLDTPL